MQDRLADSLEHITERAREIVPNKLDKIGNQINTVRSAKRVSPNVYGIYHELLIAAVQKDSSRLVELLDEFSNSNVTHEKLQHTKYGFCSSADADKVKRYQRFFDADPDSILDLTTPPAKRFSDAIELTRRAMNLLANCNVALYSEIDQMVSEIVFSVQKQSSTAEKFNGASSFPIWGAILLDVSKLPDPFAFAQSISHESGHLKVFLYAIDEPLVHNPPEDLYPSPIRTDTRPMDGNFHAVYVIARMHQTAAELLKLPDIPSHSADTLQNNLSLYAQRFRQGIDVINQHAILSSTGYRLLAGACEYMSEACSERIRLSASLH